MAGGASAIVVRLAGVVAECAALAAACTAALIAGGCTGRTELEPERQAALERRIFDPLLSIERDEAPEDAEPPRGRGLPRGPISLAEATRLALEHNHDLRLAENETSIARQQVLVARSALLPRISGGYGFTTVNPQITMETMGVSRPVLEREFNRANLTAQWLIWDFGQTLGKWQQAQLGRDIQELTRRRVAQGVIFRTADAYFNVLRARAASVVAGEALTSAQAQLRVARSLYDNGLVEKQDVLQAEVQVAEFRRDQIASDNEVQAATAALNREMGVVVNWPTAVQDAPEPPELEMDLLEVLRLAVAQRPELEVVKKAILLEQTGVTVARSEFFPEIDATAFYQYFENDFSADNNFFITDVAINLNIWSGGRKVFALRQARERVRMAISTAEQMCDTIAFQVKQAFLGVESARMQMQVAEAAVAHARENRRLVYARYREASATSADVLAAETLFVRAREDYFRARYDAAMALERLEFGIGANDLSERPLNPASNGAEGDADGGR